MPRQTKKQSRDQATQKSAEAQGDHEPFGATAPSYASSPVSQGGANVGPSISEEKWKEMVAALQEMKLANAELKRVNAELRQKLRGEMTESAESQVPQKSLQASGTGNVCQATPNLSQEEDLHRPVASSAPPQARVTNSHVDQYGQRTQPPSVHTPQEQRCVNPGRTEKGCTPSRPHYDNKPSTQRTYLGPNTSIPHLMSPDTREFLKMKIALENILPEDATERFKFKILTEHLKYEEASLVADSYRNSRQPYTDTMRMLTKMYAQPHKLAMQRIGELMDGPDVRSGDFQAFCMFALRVRSLVGMLEQLRSQGHKELECGSHVTRLLSKLPHDLNVSFKRFLYPQRVAIPTLVDLAQWLEYELEVQEDAI